jgi:pimeloyl-ACP methyl ester carboxylesterase
MRWLFTPLVLLLAMGFALGQTDAAKTVTANGVELTYIERGSGPVVILLHGGQADYRAWDYGMAFLSKSYRVISYSRRYNYPNKNPIVGTNHSAYVEADDLAGFIDALKIKRVHLVGTSIGAYTALIYAVRKPNNVLSLTLAEPNIHAWVKDTEAFNDFYSNAWRPAADAFRAGDDTGAMRILIDKFGGPGSFDRMTPPGREIAMQNARFFKAATLSTDHSPDIERNKVRRLKMPVLLIHGDKTGLMQRLIVEELAKVLTTAERHVITGAGHGSPREKPDEFMKAVGEFLVRRSPR